MEGSRTCSSWLSRQPRTQPAWRWWWTGNPLGRQDALKPPPTQTSEQFGAQPDPAFCLLHRTERLSSAGVGRQESSQEGWAAEFADSPLRVALTSFLLEPGVDPQFSALALGLLAESPLCLGILGAPLRPPQLNVFLGQVWSKPWKSRISQQG